MPSSRPRSHVRRDPPRRRGGAAVALAVAALAIVAVAALGGDPGGMPGPSGAGPGSTPTASGRHAEGTPRGAVATPRGARPEPGHEVYGFLPYWEMDAGIAEHVAATDLTTLALFSVTHRSSGAMHEGQTGFRRIVGERGRRLVREAHERGVRVEIVYTSFGADKNRRFYADEAAQSRWIEELVAFTVEHGFDGINVDVEGLPVELVPAYGGFVGRLREALRERLPAGQVSVATGAGERGAAMAAVAAAAGADRIFLMGYDYRTADSEAGASAPLDRAYGGIRDLAWSLDLYAALQVPVERTILGLPLYGVTWPVVTDEFGAPAAGRGDTWVPRRNLRVLEGDGFAPTYDATESVEFYAVPQAGSPDGPDIAAGNLWDAVYFDSPRSLRPKLALADDRGLAGAGFWAIGYERGLPEYTELIAVFRAGELAAAD